MLERQRTIDVERKPRRYTKRGERMVDIIYWTEDQKTAAISRENSEQYAKFAEAVDKIQRIMLTALDNGFTSFAEA